MRFVPASGIARAAGEDPIALGMPEDLMPIAIAGAVGLVLAFGVAALSGVVKGAVGFGMPLVIVSGLSTFLDPKIAIAGIIARDDLNVAGDFAIGHYTHEKNPVTARAALTTLDIIEDEGLVDRSATLGAHALDVGAMTVFLYTFQQREIIYNLSELLTGARFTTSYTRVGGQLRDMPPGFEASVRKFLDECEQTIEEVGNKAAFLCSDLASGITGETTFVDAGVNIMGMVFDEE